MRNFTALTLCLMGVLIPRQTQAIDEIDAVIEYDHGDNLFELLQKNDASVIHAYDRSDPSTKNKKKVFRKAAKMDIEAAESAGQKPNQWISINKELLPDNNDEQMLKMYGNIRSVAFYGFRNTPYHYEWELDKSQSVEEQAQSLIGLKNMRIKPLLPAVKCDQLDELTKGAQPTVAYFGDPRQIRDVNGKLTFLPHLHQANLMAFEKEQINFVSVADQRCMKEKGFSARDEDFTLVYYPGKESPPSVNAVTYPKKLTFGQATTWINLQYAWDKMVFNKHARVSMQNYQMNALVLFIDSVSALKSVRYEELLQIFRDSVNNFIKPNQIPLVPFIYAWDKPGFYGDVESRFEKDIGDLSREDIKFPSLAFIHAESQNIRVYENSLLPSQLSWDAIGSWAVLQSAKLDHEHMGKQIIDMKLEIGKAPGEKQMDKLQPELDMVAQTYAQVSEILPMMEQRFNSALQEAKWGKAMDEAGLKTPEDRAEFIAKAEAELQAQLQAEMDQVEQQLQDEKEQAMAAVTELVSQLDQQLQDEGISDEVQRYQMIMDHLKKEEQRLVSAQEEQEQSTTETINDEL